jgi:poly-beta-1,6-N-acetyl-D-glucosamine synthase
MWWIVGFVFLISTLYFILVSFFFVGWRRMPKFAQKNDLVENIMISVIVPCRNEDKNIRQLIESLMYQTYKNFELIIVNDHSEDDTRNHILNAQNEFPGLRLIGAIAFGKKNALREGILYSTGNFIVTTDADCLHDKDWLKTIAQFQTRNLCDLIICPVKLSNNKSVFSKIQELEFLSLVASGAGASGAGKPILCNGANLGFTRKVWLNSQEYLHAEEQSGDDMFLLESVKRQGGKIKFLKSVGAMVTTAGTDSLKQFVKQRRRWAGKSTAYSDSEIIITAGIVFAINIMQLVLLILSIFHSEYILVFLFVSLFKYIVDTIFLLSVSSFFNYKNMIFWSLLLSIFYPFYIVSIGLSSIIWKPKSW